MVPAGEEAPPAPGGEARAAFRARLPELIATIRIVFGLALMFAPSVAARPFLGREAKRPSVRYTSRVFGVRDVALGVAVLDARRNGSSAAASRALWMGAACDAFDATAALRGRDLSAWGRLLVGTTGLVSAGLGASAALSQSRPS